MQKTFRDPAAARRATYLPLSKLTMADLIMVGEAWEAALAASGVGEDERAAVSTLRHAAEFLLQAAEEIVNGTPVVGADVQDPFRWGVMKVVEFNGTLPEGIRGDLSADCFKRARQPQPVA